MKGLTIVVAGIAIVFAMALLFTASAFASEESPVEGLSFMEVGAMAMRLQDRGEATIEELRCGVQLTAIQQRCGNIGSDDAMNDTIASVYACKSTVALGFAEFPRNVSTIFDNQLHNPEFCRNITGMID